LENPPLETRYPLYVRSSVHSKVFTHDV
jgi:hypothetical protein